MILSVKEERRTSGHGITLAKTHSQRAVNELNTLSVDCVVVLIRLQKNRHNYT